MKNLLLVSLAILALICTYLIVGDLRRNNTYFKVWSINVKILDTHENRKRTLAAACHRFELDGVTFHQDVDPTEYLRLDKQHNVAFCPLPKVGGGQVY